jgi:hypothetical protein
MVFQEAQSGSSHAVDWQAQTNGKRRYSGLKFCRILVENFCTLFYPAGVDWLFTDAEGPTVQQI